MLGTQEILLILIALLLLFGPNKLPEMARSLGKMMGEFKKAQIESESELKKEYNPVNDRDLKIKKLAIELGINVENKTSEQLVDEIRVKIIANDQNNINKTNREIDLIKKS